MNKKTIVLIGTCFLISVLVVIFLFVLSEDMVHKRNSFLRQFPPHTLTEGDTIDVKYDTYYIAGGTQHSVYLGNKSAPLHMMLLNTALTDTQSVRLNVKEAENMKFWSLKLSVDSPYFYLMDGAVPIIFGGNVNNWYAERYMYDSAYFVDSKPISRTSIAMRSLMANTNEYILGKEMATRPHVNLVSDLLQKQIDGRFCVDGMISYNKDMKALVYTYYYRNQYIVTDTNLNLLYRGKTIDTVSKAQIKIASIASENSRTLAAPPLVVNKRSCSSGNFLFINSGLLAKNENRETFDKSSVIDVYNLKTGEYKLSFYIPNYADKRIRDMQVFGNKLVVLFDRYVMTYNLAPHYFKGHNK